MSFFACAHMLCRGANLPWESASGMLNPKWMYGGIASQEKDSDISIGLPLSGKNGADFMTKIGHLDC